MGRLNNELAVIQHFSHPHPLYLSSLNQQQSLAPLSCANCTLPAGTGAAAYACRPCNFNLHVSCAQMPQLINHPSHPPHPLSLLPVPAYPDGSFSCDACARHGSGFSYHCATCGVDFHTLCASMPLSVTNGGAHAHPLALVFSPPYANKSFSCDVCGGTGSDHWLYRCGVCEFDAHLECAERRVISRPVAAVALQAPAVVNRSGSWGGQGVGRVGGGLMREVVQGLAGPAITQQLLGSKSYPSGGGGYHGGNRGGRGGGSQWNGNDGGSRGGGRHGGWQVNNQRGGGGGGGAVNDQNQVSADNGAYGDDGSGNWNGYANGGDGSSGSTVNYSVDVGGGGDDGDGDGFGATVMNLGSAVLDAFSGDD